MQTSISENVPSGFMTGRWAAACALFLGLAIGPLPQSLAEQLPSCSELFPREISSPPAQRGVLVFVEPGSREDPISAEVRFAGIAQPAPILIEAGEDQSVQFAIPLHPADPVGGGEAVLQLRIGDLECPPVELTIQALPAAPGAALAAISALEKSIVDEAARIGYSREILLAARQRDLPQDVFALALALQLLTGPDNPDSARAIIDRADFDPSVLDGLVEVTGLSAAIAIMPMILADLPQRDLGQRGMAGGGLAYAAMGPGLLALSQSATGAGGLQPVYLSPAELDAQMAEQADYASRLEGVNGLARDAVGLALGAVGAVSVLTGPPMAAVIGGTTAAAGLLLTAQTLQIQYYTGTLPSQMQALALEVSKTDFEEDSEELGRWEARLTATSTGFTLGLGDVVGAMPGLGKLVGPTGKVLLKRQDIELMELPAEAQAILNQLDFMRGLMGNFVNAGTQEGFSILAPRDFIAIVDVDRPGERDYVDWVMLGEDHALVLTTDQSVYEPRRAGTSELRVQTVGGRFQGQHRLMNVDLTVHPIVVTVTGPGSATRVPIAPGETVELRATVDHAIDQRLQWTAPGGGSIIALPEADGSGPFRARFTAPETAGDYFVEAESLTRTGPRHSGQPRRYGMASLRAERLRIDPVAICIEPEQRQSFQATYPDGVKVPPSEVNWSAEAGSVDGNGGYTAPARGRSDRVTVSERRNPEITATAVVRIGGCDCRWVLESSTHGRLEGEDVSMSGVGAAAYTSAQTPQSAMDLFGMQGMEELLPPEALEALREAQAAMDVRSSAIPAYPATTFMLVAENLPGITVSWHVNPGGDDKGAFTMPDGTIHVFGDDVEGSYGQLQWSEIERGLIRGQFDSRAGRVVSFDPEVVEWNRVSGQFTMDPIPWEMPPGTPPMVGCPDPDDG